ncbi:hypothetical protein BDW59DRAFT_140224 [Aspergillus cavernicola]|uniref:Uncharacterized protein n=1 Tax=Aspergillus cavernicola TaxID=176166 RepID=A0ABR4IUN9_9EURO
MLEPGHKRESFTGLHNISKHIIFLLEVPEAISLTLKAFAVHHRAFLDCANWDEKEAVQATQKALLQVETSFQAVNLRLKSLEKRMQNIISLVSLPLWFSICSRPSLSFHSWQANLMFLPISTISTIFGWFFGLSDVEPPEIKVAHDFWIFWAISVPVTIFVMSLSYILTRREIRSLLFAFGDSHRQTISSIKSESLVRGSTLQP